MSKPMNLRIAARLIFCSLMLMGDAFISQAKEPNAASMGKSANVPDPMIFVNCHEPKENAFSLLIPKGWISEGGIFYIDAQTVNGWANSVGPKGNFVVKKDPAGTVLLHWLPDYLYCDARYTLVGQMGLMPNGSYYNGMLVMPKPSARDYLLQVIFSQIRPQASQLTVLSAEPVPELVQKYRKQAALPSLTYEACLLKLRYQQGGITYHEEMVTVIEDFGSIGQGMWQNRETFTCRAPDDQFADWQGVGRTILSSVRFNPQWLAAVSQATAQRTQNARATQEYINKVNREIVDHRQQTHADIQHENYLFLTGQEDYINPYTQEVERRPDGWKYHWQNGAGEIIMTNTEEYDPNHDARVQRTDFKRSIVRPR